MLSERCRAAHGRLLAVERRGGGALAAAVEAGAVAHADLVRAELVQAFKSKEGSFIAHFDQALEANIGACRGLELESPRKHFRLTFYYRRAEVAQDMSISVGINNYTDALEKLMH